MDSETARGVEVLKEVVEQGRILRLSDPAPLPNRRAFYFVVRAFDKEWDFVLPWEVLQDLPSMSAYQRGATQLVSCLQGRFKNPSPSMFYCTSGRVVSIEPEWPQEALPNRAASYVRARVRDSVAGSLAYAYVVITHQQTIFELKENPFALHEALANSIRVAVDEQRLKFYPPEDHPTELQELRLSLKREGTPSLSVDDFLRAKVFWMGFKMGQVASPIWLLDPWDASYLNTVVASLAQSAQVLAAQGDIQLSESSAGFASVGRLLLARARKYEQEFSASVPKSSSGKNWDVFISHATEDTDDFVRPLAELLRQRGLNVWFDEYELRLGDSLRKSIDEGLSRSRFGVVVLSPSFFAKQWTQNELAGLIALEADRDNRILPVWHNVRAADLRRYSPMLADRFAVSSAEGVGRVADAIVDAVLSVAEQEGIE